MSINFLNPLVLFGLAGVSIPWIIHLLSRHRARRTDFSSLLLLKEIQSRYVRRIRMRQWLLLVLRSLILALLILVPARPVVSGLFRAGPADHLPTAAVFILDTSASTGYVTERGLGLDFLTDRLRQIARWMNPSDRYMVIPADQGYLSGDSLWHIPGRGGSPGLEERIGRIRPTCRGTDLGPAAEAAARYLNSMETVTAREVYLLTDRQRGFLGRDTLRIPAGRSIRWYILDAHEKDPENVSVEHLGASGGPVSPGAPLKVEIGLAHYGGVRDAQCLPRLYLDGRLAGQGEALLPPNGKAKVVVEIPALEAGLHELAAVLDADDLAADNLRSILLRVPPRTRVTLIGTEAGSPDYLGAALEVLSSGQRSPFALKRLAYLPAGPAGLSGADIFVLHGLNFERGRLEAFWSRAAASGAAIMLVPRISEWEAPGAAEGFNSMLKSLGLPLSLGQVRRAAGGYDSPGFSGGLVSGSAFSSLYGTLPGLERVHIFSYLTLPAAEQPPSRAETSGGSSRVWDIPTSGGGIFLRMVRTSGMNLALAATDLSDISACDMAETPVFVPFLHGLFSLLTDYSPVVKSEMSVGETADLFFGGQVSTDRMAVHGPSESRYLLPPGEHQRISFTGTDQPGVYRLYDGTRLLGGFSVGLPPLEADLRLEDREKIKAMIGAKGVSFIGPRDNLSDLVFLDRGAVEAWPGLLVLALVLLVVEQVAANRVPSAAGDEKKP